MDTLKSGWKINFIPAQRNTYFGEPLIMGTVIENSMLTGENQMGKEIALF